MMLRGALEEFDGKPEPVGSNIGNMFAIMLEI